MKLFLLVIIICCYEKAESKCIVVRRGQCPHSNIKFWLYSKNKSPKLINPRRIDRSDFHQISKIIILIHDFNGNYAEPPITSIRRALLKHANVHVISTNYRALVKNPCYYEAVQNVPLVSKCLGQLINVLIKKNIVKNKNLHIIGFSLGAQVAGQTANYVNQKLKHITALDPIRYLFANVPRKLRLDKTDAKFIDVIHTDSLRYGFLKAMGHADFYPNFGSRTQPGCETVLDQMSCNHNRAAEYYAESIIPGHKFWSRSSEKPNQIVLMGYHASPTKHGSFFLKTASQFPFALDQQKSISDVQLGLNPMQNPFMTYIDRALEVYLTTKIRRR